MGDNMYQEQILEAIDHLRLRKARPDAVRICVHLMKKYSVGADVTKKALQKCVDAGAVFQVEYKGFYSYRNAAKSKHGKRAEPSGIIKRNVSVSSKRTGSSILTGAMSELVMDDPDYLDTGVPYEKLLHLLCNREAKHSRGYLSKLIEKSLYTGTFIRHDNGNILLAPETEGESTSPEEAPKPRHQSYKKGWVSKHRAQEKMKTISRNVRKVNLLETRKRGRIPQNKKIKKSSDKDSTSEEISETPHRLHFKTTKTGGVCSVCLKHQKQQTNESLVECKDCNTKAHQVCVKDMKGILQMRPDNTWQCPHCKYCVECVETSDSGPLTVCSICVDSYHSTCHNPLITEKLQESTQWMCGNCLKSNYQVNNEANKCEVDLEDGALIKINKIIQYESNSDTRSNGSNKTAKQEEIDKWNKFKNKSFSNGASSLTSTDENSMCEVIIKMEAEDDYENNECELRHRQPSDEVNYRERDEMYRLFERNDKRFGPDEPGPIDPSIPDASLWSCDEVYDYFADLFPNEANVFKEHEIDGKALMKLSRPDVLNNLGLLLGPAVKIYRYVVTLQYRRDDPKKYYL